MPQKLKPWNIQHIADELRESYSQCTTDTERTVWRYYAAKDCRRILKGRMPTPGEKSILDSFGIVL